MTLFFVGRLFSNETKRNSINFISIFCSYISSFNRFGYFFFGNFILNKLDPYLSKTNFYERLIRIDHKFYHHTLKENVKYEKAASFDQYRNFEDRGNKFKEIVNKQLSESLIK